MKKATFKLLYSFAAVALTLVTASTSVFAQSESTDETMALPLLAEEQDIATSSEQITESEILDPYADTYPKEMLPNKAVFGDFVVGPGRYDLEIAPGESRTVELTISNRMGDRRLVQLSTEDTDASAAGTGAVDLLGAGVRGPYTLKDYVTVPHERFWLEHSQRARVPVTISIPEDAEPGGFYGSIITQIVSSEEDAGDGGVSASGVIVSRIASLIFVKTPGEVELAGGLTSFSTRNEQSFYLSGPIDFNVTVENQGSVHLNPAANVSIRNIVGDSVGFIQISPWYVFPKSVRTREVTWDREFLFGRYTATVDLSRGYDDIIDTRTIVFWVLPWKYLVNIFIGLFVFFLIIRFFTTRFEFKRKT